MSKHSNLNNFFYEAQKVQKPKISFSKNKIK